MSEDDIKQDCETKAFRRLTEKIDKRYKKKKYLRDSDWSETRYSSLIGQAIQNNFTLLELEFMCAVQSGIKAYFFWDTKSKIINCDKSIEKYLFLHNQNITSFTHLEDLKQEGKRHKYHIGK